MRAYLSIWNRVKKEGTAVVSADVSLHKRIIKAVRKERTRDISWRVAQTNLPCTRLVLRVEIVESNLIFRLVPEVSTKINHL